MFAIKRRRITWIVAGIGFLVLAAWIAWMQEGRRAESLSIDPLKPGHIAGEPDRMLYESVGMTVDQAAGEYDRLLSAHTDMTYDQLKAELHEPRDYVTAFPFDPTQARFFELVKQRLKLTPQELVRLDTNGFVAIDTGSPVKLYRRLSASLHVGLAGVCDHRLHPPCAAQIV